MTAEFTDETHGTTWGHWVASADTYGADRKWVLLKGIPIELESEDDAMEVEGGEKGKKNVGPVSGLRGLGLLV